MSATGTEARVCEDIAARQELGVRKYGTTVEGNKLPLIKWLRHGYEESLDHSIYLRRAMEEQELLIEKWENRIFEIEQLPYDGVFGRKEALSACAVVMREFVRDLKGEK